MKPTHNKSPEIIDIESQQPQEPRTRDGVLGKILTAGANLVGPRVKELTTMFNNYRATREENSIFKRKVEAKETTHEVLQKNLNLLNTLIKLDKSIPDKILKNKNATSILEALNQYPSLQTLPSESWIAILKNEDQAGKILNALGDNPELQTTLTDLDKPVRQVIWAHAHSAKILKTLVKYSSLKTLPSESWIAILKYEYQAVNILDALGDNPELQTTLADLGNSVRQEIWKHAYPADILEALEKNPELKTTLADLDNSVRQAIWKHAYPARILKALGKYPELKTLPSELWTAILKYEYQAGNILEALGKYPELKTLPPELWTATLRNYNEITRLKALGTEPKYLKMLKKLNTGIFQVILEYKSSSLSSSGSSLDI